MESLNITVTGPNIHQVYARAEGIAQSYGSYGTYMFQDLLKLTIDKAEELTCEHPVILIKNYDMAYGPQLIEVLNFFNPGLLIIITTSVSELPEWLQLTTAIYTV